MQRSAKEKKVSQVFCLGVVVSIRVTENAPYENSSRKGPNGCSRMPP